MRQSEKQPSKKPFVVKVYLVFVSLNTAKDGQANRKIVAAKLTWSAANHIKDQIPGSYVERVYADKEVVDIDGDLSVLLESLKGEKQPTER